MTILNKEQLQLISDVLWCMPKDIQILHNDVGGMTNSSILIVVWGKKYIVRLPGKGSDKLVNREQECQIYNFLHKNGYDDITVFASKNGIKISKYIVNSRTCCSNNIDDILLSMKKLRELHELKFQPNVEYFSLLQNIKKYQKLIKIKDDKYNDVYNRCLKIDKWIDTLPKNKCLCQIDANPDNIVFSSNISEPTLIDWEYAGLQDPHVDIAMWAVYCNYDICEFDTLISCYFRQNIDDIIRYKIYGYAALAGLLWYNWCLYKKQKYHISYGEYTKNQFKYADKFSKLVIDYINGDKK